MPQLGQTEIENLDAVVFGDEKVFRFEVAMDDAPGVSGRQSAGDLLSVINRLALRYRAFVELRSQFFAFQQFGDDVGRAFVNAQIVDKEDIRMIERRSSAGLLIKEAQPVHV